MTNSPFVDHYETLQVSQTADCETVERVYRLLAKRYHPDNSVSGNTERFTQVQTAHEVLSNPELRAEYDVRYDQEKAVHWQIFDQTNAADGHEYDQRLFHGILSVLYVARRRSPNTGGLGEIHLERMLATPREHLDFPLWYLKQHNWIERLDNGMVAITIDGIDKIGSKGLALPNDRLLTESSSGSSDQRAGAEKPATRSLPGLPGAPSRQHVIAGDTVTTPVTDAPHVLVVDDDGATRLLLRRALEEEGYSVDEAASDEEGKASVERRQPDAVLLNTDSTHRDGFAFCARLRSLPGAANIPIVMILALCDDESIARASEAGVSQYVAKPINHTLLTHRLRRAISEHRVPSSHLADYDSVTGLPNGLLLLDRFRPALARAKRQHERLALIRITLDQFTQVSTSMGNDVGDHLLKAVGDRFASFTRSCDVSARLGGEEFVVLLTTAVTDEGVGIVAENLLRLLSVPIAVAKEEVSLTASLGAAVYPHDGDDISTLLQNADAAMSSAKQSGGNTYCRASAA